MQGYGGLIRSLKASPDILINVVTDYLEPLIAMVLDEEGL